MLLDELRGWKASDLASDDTIRMIWLMRQAADRLEAAERALAAYPMLHPSSAEPEAELRREWERDNAPAIEAARRERY